jgi:hypothetical protein
LSWPDGHREIEGVTPKAVKITGKNGKAHGLIKKPEDIKSK